MRYRNIILTIICFTLSSASIKAADNNKTFKASLKEVTVFFSGAELTHKVSIPITKGVNEVYISEISPSIDINSLKINTSKGIIIASHEYSQDYITLKTSSAVERALKDSVDYYKNKITEYVINQETNANLLGLLDENKSIGGSQTGLKVDELIKLMEYYKTQANTLYKAQKELEKKQEKAEEALERVEYQLRQESAKNRKSTGILKLNLTAPLSTNAEFTVTYFTNQANWIPYYDINVPGTDEKIQIASKAKVAQTTGIDWNKVKLTLSTGMPSTNKEAPLFNAWFLDFAAPSITSKLSGSMSGVVQNSYSYRDKEVVNKPENDFYIRGISTMENKNKPLILINGQESTKSDLNSLSPEMVKEFNILRDASATAIYGSRASNGVILITTKALNDYIQREEGVLNMTYSIDLPYTILGNGKVQSIDLQTHSVSAEFKHYATPKLDGDVFILAEIPNWQELGLLSGKANVTFDNTYVGETTINTESTMQKLALTLGTDKRVSVKREMLQDYSSNKFMGNDTQQDFVYKITVKNNQNKPVKIVLKDQYPLSKQKDIKVELLKETTSPTYNNEEAGVLSWEFELPAGESRDFKTAYRVKYPKDKSINL